jgi:hypothetical protein
LEAGLGSWLRPQENDNSADVAWTPITQNYLSSYCFYVLESGLKMWRDVIEAAFGTHHQLAASELATDHFISNTRLPTAAAKTQCNARIFWINSIQHVIFRSNRTQYTSLHPITFSKGAACYSDK